MQIFNKHRCLNIHCLNFKTWPHNFASVLFVISGLTHFMNNSSLDWDFPIKNEDPGAMENLHSLIFNTESYLL